jgi:hypothetical protein
VTSAAPKTRPLISGETTLAELEAILRAHHVEDVSVCLSYGQFDAAFDELGNRCCCDHLHDALNDALLGLRITDADELGLTEEEARS